jgi:hypothetical protein
VDKAVTVLVSSLPSWLTGYVSRAKPITKVTATVTFAGAASTLTATGASASLTSTGAAVTLSA